MNEFVIFSRITSKGGDVLTKPGATAPPAKVKDDSTLMSRLTARLTKIKSISENMVWKRGSIYIEWLKEHAQYLTREVGFKPTSMRRYKRREIILVNFGFNVGSEIGGVHFAVVMTDSNVSNAVVNVIPLGSLEAHETETDIHKTQVYLGIIPGMNGLQSYAITNQLRPVSKMRIIKPTSVRDNTIRLGTELMDKIDKQVVSMYVKGYISSKELEAQETAKVEIKQVDKEAAVTADIETK